MLGEEEGRGTRKAIGQAAMRKVGFFCQSQARSCRMRTNQVIRDYCSFAHEYLGTYFMGFQCKCAKCDCRSEHRPIYKL